jgi:hypothetical protein
VSGFVAAPSIQFSETILRAVNALILGK